jgi:diaminopimelate decarboxylase
MENLNFLTETEVRDLAKEHGTPLFVYSEKRMIESIQYLQKLPHYYGLTVRYSVKANPNQSILKIFNKHGCYFDVSSTYEALRAIKSGVEPSKILLTAQEMSSGWEDLCKDGVNFDAGSLSQLKEYGEKFRGTKVSVRINPGIGSGLVKKLTSGGDASSFGIWHEQLDQVISIQKEYELKIVRLHFHIGSGHDPEVLELTVNKALELCEKLSDVETLNLGGGYKRKILSTDKDYDQHKVGHHIKDKLANFFQKTNRKLHLEIEPGTFLMAMSGSLLTKVIDKVETGKEGYRFIKIDAGLTELIRPSYYGDYHPIVTVNGDECRSSNEPSRFMICGHCCIAGDNLTPKPGSNGVDFSPATINEPEIGDYLVVERAGGYCSSMALKNFNSYPEAKEILVREMGDIHTIRERQTLDQIIQNEIDVEI